MWQRSHKASILSSETQTTKKAALFKDVNSTASTAALNVPIPILKTKEFVLSLTAPRFNNPLRNVLNANLDST